MNAYLVLARAFDEGGWIVNGVFSTFDAAAEYASTVPHEVFVVSRVMDEFSSWEEHRAASTGDPVVAFNQEAAA